jgi:ankyrin repeat protein
MSAYRGDTEKVRDHLNTGFPIDYELNDAGWRLVHIAAYIGNCSLMKLLIQTKADLNVRDLEEQWTPLMIAAMNSRLEIVRLLTSNGADLLAVDLAGKASIDLARQYQCRLVEEYLRAKLAQMEELL